MTRAEIERVIERAQRLTAQRRFIEDGVNVVATRPDGSQYRLGPFRDRGRWRDARGRYCETPEG